MYQGRTLKILNTLPALIAMAMLAVCKVAPASGATSGANLIFSYPSGLATAVGAGAIHLTGSAALNGSSVNILGGPAQHEFYDGFHIPTCGPRIDSRNHWVDLLHSE
jgi:hypothetical protein